MSTEHLLILLLVMLCSVAHSILMKFTSLELDHEMAPFYIGFWVLIGTLVYSPFVEQNRLFELGSQPIVLCGTLLKGILLWVTLIEAQRLRFYSLSSSQIVNPVSLGFITIVNGLFGERLRVREIVSIFCLVVLGYFFQRFGHLNEVAEQQKALVSETRVHLYFFRVIALFVVLALLDHLLLPRTDWYSYLVISNAAVLLVAVSRIKTWKVLALLSHRNAGLAGLSFAAYELGKFYLLDTAVPVSIMAGLESGLVAVILLISAILFNEQSVKKQLGWGIASLFFMYQLIG